MIISAEFPRNVLLSSLGLDHIFRQLTFSSNAYCAGYRFYYSGDLSQKD